MKKPIEIDIELLAKLETVANKENLPLESLIELSIMNFLIEKGLYGKV